MDKQFIIFGAGGFAKEIFFYLRDYGIKNVIGFIDNKQKGELYSFPIYDSDSFFNPRQHIAVLAIGNPSIRQKIVSNLPKETEYFTLIHPSAKIFPNSKIGKGSIICPNSIISSEAELEDFSQINVNSYIAHETKCGNYFTTAPGVNICGKVNIGNNVYFGVNSCIIENLNVCDNVFIGAGAVIINSIYEPGTYVGVPARKLEK